MISGYFSHMDTTNFTVVYIMLYQHVFFFFYYIIVLATIFNMSEKRKKRMKRYDTSIIVGVLPTFTFLPPHLSLYGSILLFVGMTLYEISAMIVVIIFLPTATTTMVYSSISLLHIAVSRVVESKYPQRTRRWN